MLRYCILAGKFSCKTIWDMATVQFFQILFICCLQMRVYNHFHCRIDKTFAFKHCDADRIVSMFDNFFPKADISQKVRLQNILEENKKAMEEDSIAPIELQRHFLEHSESPSDAIENMYILKGYLKSDFM